MQAKGHVVTKKEKTVRPSNRKGVSLRFLLRNSMAYGTSSEISLTALRRRGALAAWATIQAAWALRATHSQ